MIKAFILSDNAMNKFHDFRNTHEETCETPSSISFTFLEWGQVVMVECMGCGKVLDLTEFNL